MSDKIIFGLIIIVILIGIGMMIGQFLDSQNTMNQSAISTGTLVSEQLHDAYDQPPQNYITINDNGYHTYKYDEHPQDCYNDIGDTNSFSNIPIGAKITYRYLGENACIISYETTIK